MSKTFGFSEFKKQSLKGIIVIYGSLIIKMLRKVWILFFLLFFRFSESVKIYIPLVIAGILIFLFIRSYLLFQNLQFKVQGNYFMLKKGIFSKKNTSIAFNRIQNIKFSQNLIQQLINVYEVHIETADFNETEISIEALSPGEAKALKDKISNKNYQQITEREDSIKPLLKIDIKSLVKVSLSENHLQSLALFLSLLLGFYQQLEEVFENFIDKETDVIFGSFLLIISPLTLLLIVAVISSFIRVFLFHFNLIFSIKRHAFEIKQGLISEKIIILKKEKIKILLLSRIH